VARAPREEEPGGFYHVAARGSCGQDIFFDDTDRRELISRLDRTNRPPNWICLAYCLMTNHFHLVVTIPDGGLSSGMQELVSGYSRQTNRRYGRRDHLFRQHFFSVRLKRHEHLLEVSRYVVLNPVRAGLCRLPEDWRWSSYRACAGLSFAPAFLARDKLLALFGRSPEVAEGRYRDFVAAGRFAVSDIGTGA
jgi:REP element-mobilizing transposase RayT